jgi:RNA polymerase sigma-70 factor (ECF subfamily)
VPDDPNSTEQLRWERAVLERVKRGEGAAFGELYRAYAALLYRQVLYPALGNRSAAEDALAETFRTALQRLDQFQPQDVSVYFWLCRIAKNKATDMHRAKQVTKRALVNLERLIDPSAADNPTPEIQLADARRRHDLGNAVKQILAQLNPRYARALELRFIADRSREDCAQELEVKIATFDVLLLRALRSFRQHWDAHLQGNVQPRLPETVEP